MRSAVAELWVCGAERSCLLGKAEAALDPCSVRKSIGDGRQKRGRPVLGRDAVGAEDGGLLYCDLKLSSAVAWEE